MTFLYGVLAKRNMTSDLKLHVLNRREQINLTLNREKCQFRVPEVSHIVHILNAKGVQPDSEKVRAIQDMPPPVDKKGWRDY